MTSFPPAQSTSSFPGFRPLEAVPSPGSSPPLTITRDASPTHGQEVVPYVELPAATPSQNELVTRAEAGDLDARVELIKVKAAENALAHRYCRHDPSRTILSYLRDPGEGVAPHEAAAAVLEDFADQTEDTALDTLLVFRLIQAHELWKNHPDPSVRSAEDLVRALKQRDFVQALIVMGASVESGKRTRIALVDAAWGPGWFDKIPEGMRNPQWLRVEQCSRKLLTEIAATAEQGVSLEAAVEQWKAAIEARNDYRQRRERKIRAQTGPYLLPSDVAAQKPQPPSGPLGHAGNRLGRVADDMLTVEVVPAGQDRAKPSSPPPLPKTKRRRPIVEDSEDEAVNGGDDGWTVSEDGKTIRKRVGKQIMYRSAERITDSDEEALSQLVQEMSSPGGREPTPLPVRKSCDGVNVALVLRKFHRAFQDARLIDAPGAEYKGVCDCCRPWVQEAMEHITTKLVPCAVNLEAVRTHLFDEQEFPATQDHSISPLKRPTEE